MDLEEKIIGVLVVAVTGLVSALLTIIKGKRNSSCKAQEVISEHTKKEESFFVDMSETMREITKANQKIAFTLEEMHSGDKDWRQEARSYMYKDRK